MNERLQFYYAQDTCSLASHVALEDAEALYDLHRLSIEQGEHNSGSYLEINPKGRVPALVTPSGVLTETPAILVYISQLFPDAQLAPVGDPYQFARLQEFNSFMASTLHVAHAHRMRGHRWVDDEAAIEAMQRKVPVTVAAAYSHIEDFYLDGPFVLGQHYSVADPYLFTFAQWMEPDGVDPLQFPKVAEHREMMAQRPTVRRALEAEAA
ncbi:glutathione S-transferase family protein [Aestuariibius sp. 2305UL40-4]|uniref:glutathione S-transferase family protein n=1 Tax=Aestuariibius violaceus TaxID=3234132 RepID=UPI00345EF832